MKIAIHKRPASFSARWILYCQENNVPFKIVNCYDSDIIEQLKDCDGLMWHWAHYDHKAQLFARQLTYSLEIVGKKVFPDSKTCWHYDDKLGQKYLLEVIGAPFVPTYVFYDKSQALKWAENARYPMVFKLRGGAGSENVKIVRDIPKAKKLIKQAFGKGFKARDRKNFLKERLWHFKRDKDFTTLFKISKGIGRLFIPTEAEKTLHSEKNYVYFQEFIPENDHDIRIIVIGNRAFAIKRMVRERDFRASGSGVIVYDPSQIPRICIEWSFKISSKLQSQCLAYDFVFQNNKPFLVEISYAFARTGYLPCPGYWDETLAWHEGMFYPEWFMIEDFLQDI